MLAFALVITACSDDGEPSTAQPDASTPDATDAPTTDEPGDDDSNPPGDRADEATAPPAEDGEPPSNEPEWIEIAYWEAVERGTTEIDRPADGCSMVDEQTERCEGDLTFHSITTHLGRAFDQSVMTTTSYSESCPGSDEPGSTWVLRDGSITSQWGDEIFFTAGRDACITDGPTYWMVTGGTGRFEGASAQMSSTLTNHPAFAQFGTGVLRVRADLWTDWLPAQPTTPPPADVDYLDIPWFDAVIASESTVQADEDCDRTDTDVIVCTVETNAELKGTLLGTASFTTSGESTQLLTEACELEDGSSGIPRLVDTEGTIVGEFGDELFFAERTRIDPCATAGSGTSGAVGYRRAIGGTGRFADAHGVVSTVATPGLGYESVGAGTVSVRADQWPQLAEEYAGLPDGPDFLELRYFERFLSPPDDDDFAAFLVEPPEDCDVPEEGVQVCDYTFTGYLTGTHISSATEIQTGTITREPDDPCPDGTLRQRREGSGVITTGFGYELDFRNVSEPCDITYWVLDDGTGRFQDAGGVMTGFAAPELGDDTAALQIGMFRLRADLYEDLLPETG